MTSQLQPAPGEAEAVRRYLRPLRDSAAYVLVGATAVLLFVAIVQLIPDGLTSFSVRSEISFEHFVNLATTFFPLGAVLLAVGVGPRHPNARLLVLAAAVEYAVAVVFGALFGVLIGLVNRAADNGARLAFEELLTRLAWLAVIAVAAYATLQIWRGMFGGVSPAARSNLYGRPAHAAPPQPAGHGYPPAQPVPGPGPGASGHQAGQAPFAPVPPQPGPAPLAPTQSWNRPVVPGQPQPTAPHGVSPASPDDPTAPQLSALSEPTQPVPQHHPAHGRPEPADEDTPGGRAGQNHPHS